MRWLIALSLSLGLPLAADAGVFKQRGKPDSKAAAPAKKPAVEKAPPSVAAPAKKAPAKAAAAPAKKATPVAAKTPGKKGPKSAVAAGKGRPDDLTPDPGNGGVVITETTPDEDDVIIRDIDD